MSVAITEMATLIAEELHLVKQGANGFPELLAKSAAEEVQNAALDEMDPDEIAQNPDAAVGRRPTHTRRSDMAKKKNKKAKKSKMQSLAKAIGQLSTASEGKQRRRNLRKSMEIAAKSGDMQTARSLSYQLAREDSIAVRKDAIAGLASAGLSTQRRDPIARRSDQDQPREILRGSGQAVGNAQRPRGRDVGNSQRDTLRDAYSGEYRPEYPDPDETMLESQSRIVELEGALRKAKSPGEREMLGYQLTKALLVDGHRRGVI